MYQSIPKRVYTSKESAMPKIAVPQSYSAERNECNTVSNISAIPKTAKVPKIPQLSKKLEGDDLLLIGLLLLLISEDGDNQLLIAVMAFLLFS